MDELAVAAGIDPVELRIRNEPEADPESGKPFSSRNLVACLREGAERFGWSERDPRPGVRRQGRWLVGTGVASSLYPARAVPSRARATVTAEGAYAVEIAAADIGTGARTAIGLVAAEALGVTPAQVEVRIGVTGLPPAMIAGGSMGMASWAWAVELACRDLRRRLDEHGGAVPPGGLVGPATPRGRSAPSTTSPGSASAPSSPRPGSTSTPARCGCRGCWACSPPGGSSTRWRPDRSWSGA